MRPIVWVIEMKEDRKYSPCAGALLTRKDAIKEMKNFWKFNNPDDKFRVAKYARVGK